MPKSRAMKTSYSSEFKKQYKKLSAKIRKQTKERLAILIEDEINPMLKNHKLHGDYSEYRSINITGDIRVVYQKISLNHIFLIAIGSHSQLY